MASFRDNLRNGFRDLTGPAGFSMPEFLTTEQLYKFNKDRFNFYQQIIDEMSNPNSQIVDRVFSIASRSRSSIRKLREALATISRDMMLLRSQYAGPDNKITGTNGEAFNKALNRINDQLEANLFLKGYRISKIAGGAMLGPEVKDFAAAKAQLAAADDDDKLRRFKIEYEAHPVFSPDNERVVVADRVIFIAITFMFRGLSLFLVEWALNSYMIDGLGTAIYYYFGFYLLLFSLLVLLANSTTETQLFRMLFYYVNTDNGPDSKAGWGRILVHAVVQLALLPVPFIVAEGSGGASGDTGDNTAELNFSQRRNIMRVLSNFTLVIWILTSAIALRF